MSVVGEIELPVIALPGSFMAELVRIADEGAVKAGKVASASFIKQFTVGLRAGGKEAFGAFFASADVTAAQAGIASGKAYSSGFTEALRTRGAVASAGVGGDARAIAGSQAAGLAAGRAYSRGMTAGQAEGNFARTLENNLRAAELGAAGSGRRAGIGFATSFKGGLASAGVAAVIAGIFSVVEANKYNQQLALIQTQAGATAKAVAEIGKQTLSLAPQVGFNPDKIAEAYYHAASAGFTLSEQQRLVAASSKGAAIGQSDLEKTTQALIATTRSGIKGVSGMDDAMNILIRTVGIGDLRMPALVSALSTGIVPAAKSAGLSLEDVSASLAVLGDNVVPAQQAATRLRMTFSLLAAPSDKAIAQLKEIGLNGDSLAMDLQKPQGLLVAVRDLKTHLDAAFPPNDGHKLTIAEQRTALLEYTGTLKGAGISGKELANDQTKMAESLANGTSSLVKQNQAIQRIFGGGRTSSAFLTLYEEVDLLEQKYHLLGTTQSRAEFAAAAWAKQQSLLGQRWKEFVAGLDVGIIRIGQGLTPAFSGVLGFLSQIPKYLTPFAHDVRDAWRGVVDLAGALKPIATFALEAFGGAVLVSINAIGFVLRDVVAPALHVVADGFSWLERTKPAAIGLAAVIGTILLPTLIAAGGALAADVAASIAFVAVNLAESIMAAATAMKAFVASNPYLVAAAVVIGGIAAAMSIFGKDTTQTKVDVESLDGAIKHLAETGSRAELAQGILGQISKWEVGSNHQTGVEYLNKYGVSASGISAALSDPKNKGAFNSFISSLDGTAQRSLLLGEKFGGNAKAMGSFQAALHSTNPAVQKLAELFQNLEKDPTVRGRTVQDLISSFSKLSGGLDSSIASAEGATKAQKTYGQTVADTSKSALQSELDVVTAASKGQEAIGKIDAAMRLSTADALDLIGTISTWNDQAASSASSLADAQSGLVSAQGTLGEKQTAYNDALSKFGAGSKEAVSAYNNVQDAANGVAKATQAVNAAQPPSVDSVLKKLGLDDATLKQLSGASSKLISEGISGPALTQLLSLNDPRALLAFSQGGKKAVDSLNKAVGQFLNDSGPESFAALQTQYKQGGAAGVDAYISGVQARAKALTDTQNSVFSDSAGQVVRTVLGIMTTLGRDLPDDTANAMISRQESFLNALAQTFTGPQRTAVQNLVRLAEDGGIASTTALANAIRNHTPLVISKQEALKDGINEQTRLILQSIGITVKVDDQATFSLKQIADATKALALTGVASTTFSPSLAQAPGLYTGQKKARGGKIVGPGTSTSDSILGLSMGGVPTAWVSRDEYVVNARATAMHQPLLEAINATGLADGGLVGSTPASTQAARGVASLLATLNLDAVVSKLSDLAAIGAAAATPIGSGVARWIPDIIRALNELHLPLRLLPRAEAQMQLESSGNERAINLTDSNAAKGQPSMGLMQTIATTFASYAGPYAGLGIWNGFANIYAGLNYAAHRYAGDPNIGLGYGHGYDSGGILPVGMSLAHNATGKPEAVLTAAQWRTIETMVAQVAKFGVTLAEKAATGGVSAGEKAIAAAVKEGNGPLAVRLERLVKAAEGRLYSTTLGAVADKSVSPAEYARVTADAATLKNLTAQLTRISVVNQGVIDNLKTFVSAEQAVRDSIKSSLTQGAGLNDLLATSGSAADVSSQLSEKLSGIRAFAGKITALKKHGFTNAVIREVAADGVDTGSLYADILLTASAAQVRSIDAGYDALTGAETSTANSITKLTQTAPGKAAAGVYIQQAIFTSGANVDALVSKAEYAQRTALMDDGGWLMPGRTVVDNQSGGPELVLDRAASAGYGSSGGVTVHQTNHYEGVDLATAHAQSSRDLSLALAKVVS